VLTKSKPAVGRHLMGESGIDPDVSIDSPPIARRRRSLRVRLDLAYGTVDAGSGLPYTVRNQTRLPILAAADYGFEKRAALFWRSQPVTEARVGAGGPVEAGKRSELSARIPHDFHPGRYRLTTQVTPLDQNGLPVFRGIWPVNVKLVSKAFSVKPVGR
jgi:hypothetical protein